MKTATDCPSCSGLELLKKSPSPIPARDGEGHYTGKKVNTNAPANPTPRFFQLTTEGLVALSHLRRSELLIYLYLRTLCPFPGQETELDLKHLKQITGIRSLGTIYPALAELHRQRLIVWFNVRSSIKVGDLAANVSMQTVEVSTRSACRSYDRRADRTIGVPIVKPLELAHSAESTRSKIKKTKKSLKKEEEIYFSEEYRRFIQEGIDALPKPPKGAYRAAIIEKALGDENNLRLFSERERERDQAIFSAAAAAAQNFELSKQEQPEDTLELMIVRKRAEWVAYPRKRKAIALWCEENGVRCNESGIIGL